MSLATFFAELEAQAKTILGDLFDAERAALAPIAATAVSTAETDIVTSAATGKMSSLGTTLGALVTNVGVQAEAAGITTAAVSVLGAVAQALTANPKTAAATAAPAPAA